MFPLPADALQVFDNVAQSVIWHRKVPGSASTQIEDVQGYADSASYQKTSIFAILRFRSGTLGARGALVQENIGLLDDVDMLIYTRIRLGVSDLIEYANRVFKVESKSVYEPIFGNWRCSAKEI